jgi:cell division protease FtsH
MKEVFDSSYWQKCKKLIYFLLITVVFYIAFSFITWLIPDFPRQRQYSHMISNTSKLEQVQVTKDTIYYKIEDIPFYATIPQGYTKHLDEFVAEGVEFEVLDDSGSALTLMFVSVAIFSIFGVFFFLWVFYKIIKRATDYYIMNPYNVPNMNPYQDQGMQPPPQDYGPPTNKGDQYSQSGVKKVSPKDANVRFSDVAGNKEIKDDLQVIIDFLKNPRKYKEMGAKMPSGVVLHGPPGTGKTLLARAVAGEAKCPFFYISGSDFVEMYVGVGASRVRDMFKTAREQAPCILFIDEIDAVGKKRSAGGRDSERDQTLNQMLTEMDGFGQENSGVVVIAATNRLDTLDPALLRPGRFDEEFFVDLPDKEERIEIMELHLEKMPFLEDKIDTTRLSKMTIGFSGADLYNMVNKSAIMAVRDGLKEITHELLEMAVDVVCYGPENKKKKPDMEELTNTAWHEIGHAYIAKTLDSGSQIDKVTIIPRTKSLGHVSFLGEEKHKTKKQLNNKICMMMGGRIGEELLTGGDYTPGASSDIQQATNLARDMVLKYGMSELGMVNYQNFNEGWESYNLSDDTLRAIDSEVKNIIDKQYRKAKRILEDNKHAVEFLANKLIEMETMTGEVFETQFELANAHQREMMEAKLQEE